MPIDTTLTGEDARDLINKIGLSRMGFNGLSCYCFLEDGSAIKITPIHVPFEGTKIEFTHRILLPLDKIEMLC